ncbi:unnamed protein product, partial [Brenthis ino]
MSDAKVPKECNDYQKYHSKCYKTFSALPPNHRGLLLSKLSSTSSLQEEPGPSDSCPVTPSTSACNEGDADSDASYHSVGEKSIANDEEGNGATVMNTSAEEIEVSGTEGTVEESSSTKKDSVCIFCNKKRKKFRNREQNLQTCLMNDAVNSLKSDAKEMGDDKLYQKIVEACDNNEIIFYHKICRNNYMNAAQSHITASKDIKTDWHVSRDMHKKAFEELCQFVTNNIIRKNQCYFLSFLKNLFIDFAKSQDINSSTNLEPYNLESRLLEAFPKKISIIKCNNHKVVKPYHGHFIQNDLDTLEKQDILDRAALILRSEIRQIERKPLTDEPTANDLIKGECDIPPVLMDFYSKLI